MPFVMKKSRRQEFTYKDEESGESFTAVFEFICMEDRFSKEFFDKLKNYDSSNPDVGTTTNILWYNIRKSLVALEGVVDEDGAPITIVNEDGTVNEGIQKAALEYIIGFEGMSKDIMTAFIGSAGKN